MTACLATKLLQVLRSKQFKKENANHRERNNALEADLNAKKEKMFFQKEVKDMKVQTIQCWGWISWD